MDTDKKKNMYIQN